jgi:hypothetical protein
MSTSYPVVGRHAILPPPRACARPQVRFAKPNGILFQLTDPLSGGVAVLTVTFPLQNEIPGIGSADHWHPKRGGATENGEPRTRSAQLLSTTHRITNK